MSERAGVLVVGGGVIGSSVACALARRGVEDVVVVDLDLAGVYASSELNAGGARATWWQPVNIDTCQKTLEFFDAHRDAFSFHQAGYLWLYSDPALYERALENREQQNARGLGVELVSSEELDKRYPILDRALDELCGATYSPRDGLVNPNTVRAWYRAEAERLGVRFRNRHYVTGVTTARLEGESGTRRVQSVDVLEIERGDPDDSEGIIRQILTSHRIPSGAQAREMRIDCDVIVNCLGAWSPIFSAKIGVRDVTEPVRRQISLVDVHESDLPDGVSFEGLGMIVDASGLYFHPEGPYILAGYSIPEEAPGFDFSYDGAEFFESQIWSRLAHRCSSFERCGHVRGWAGLYAVTPDCSGIAGRVTGFSNLYEAHSFTGRGVMQSYAIGSEMAALIATGDFGEIDLAPLARERFDDPSRWVQEDLHI